MAEIHYENGNVHSAVVVVGDDPTNEDNVLVSRLATSVSVPKANLSQEEGTPAGMIPNDSSEIAQLKKRLSELENKGKKGKKDEEE